MQESPCSIKTTTNRRCQPQSVLRRERASSDDDIIISADASDTNSDTTMEPMWMNRFVSCGRSFSEQSWELSNTNCNLRRQRPDMIRVSTKGLRELRCYETLVSQRVPHPKWFKNDNDDNKYSVYTHSARSSTSKSDCGVACVQNGLAMAQ
jgi:hypothetical protein